jgi:hypothetical protein
MRVERNYLYLLLFQAPACVFLGGFQSTGVALNCGLQKLPEDFLFPRACVSWVRAVFALRFALSTLFSERRINKAYGYPTLLIGPPLAGARS